MNSSNKWNRFDVKITDKKPEKQINKKMKNTMTLFGCGPKLALLCLPYILLALIIMIKYPEFFDLRFIDLLLFKVLGIFWLGMGLIFWVYSAVYFLKYFQPGKLITKGPFALCRNPIYSSIIVFIIPSLAIISFAMLI